MKFSLLASILISILFFSTSAYCFTTKSFQAGTDRSKTDITALSKQVNTKDIVNETRLLNDIQAVLVSGNTTITLQTQTQFTVIVRNRGSNPQSNYLVKLYSNDNVELALASGPALTPGQFGTVVFNWVPPLAGNFNIYGKVEFAEDQNNQNDQTTNLNITIPVPPEDEVHIGNGNASQRQPFGINYGFERDATLYTREQIGFGNISLASLAWYCSTTSPNPVSYRIYLKTTSESTLTPMPWTTMVSDAQLVKEGTIICNQTGLVNFPLNSFWNYFNGNLVVMIETNYGGTGAAQYPRFNSSLGSPASHEYWYQNNNVPSGNGNINASVPDIVMTFWHEAFPRPFNMEPQNCVFNLQNINASVDRTFTLMNIGGGTIPITVNSITLAGSPVFSIIDLPALPTDLASSQTIHFAVRYNPTEVGTQQAIITITETTGETQSQHIATITGSCIDPTIDTLPYVENFDNLTLPNLPINWTQRSISPGSVTVFTTANTSPNSSPYCICLNNSSTTDGPYLISPPLDQSIPISTARIRFWARGNYNSVVNIGIISDPASTDTFVQTASLSLNTTWTEYFAAFQAYNGNGHYIAFKYSDVATFQFICIDDVIIEASPQNDLVAVSLTGTSTPSMQTNSRYTVNISNVGINPQPTYLVKLYTQGDIEVASAAGPLINPGQSLQVSLTWFPAALGGTYIYAKVLFTGDENNQNNQTANLNVNVFPFGTFAVTVGDNSEVSRMPMDFAYKNSLTETIYFPSDIGNIVGCITGITFYNLFSDNLPDMPTKIWMGTTAQSDLSLGWIPSTQLISVFDGRVSYPAGENLVTILFPTPYLWLENNLVIMINRPMDVASHSVYDRFYCKTIGTSRTRYAYSDDIEFFPAFPTLTSVNLTGQVPKTSFLYAVDTGVPSLNGFVYDTSNIPVAGATVQILNGEQTTTDEQGHYIIHNVDAGTYGVTVSKPLYLSQTATITLSEDNWPSLNFILTQMLTGTLSGNVRNQANESIAGATITAGDFTATTSTDGAYSLQLPAGTYTVTCAAPTYNDATFPDVVINEDQTTTQDFLLTTMHNPDETPVIATRLKSNYPNPFHPATTITFDIKDKAPVRIDIYNTKGQLIRNLINETKSNGRHEAVWNGKDNYGNKVASGIYQYRMQTGKYRATHTMLMLK
jgi:hypothetical protein